MYSKGNFLTFRHKTPGLFEMQSKSINKSYTHALDIKTVL